MKCLQLKVLNMLMAVAMYGWAQGTQQSVDQQGQQEPPANETKAPRNFPFEVAGYVNFRYLNDDALQEHHFFREYSGSLFLIKTVGRWRFHSELNANTAPEYDSYGIYLLSRRPSLSVKLDSAFVNYNARDWLQVQAGLLFIPTYWPWWWPVGFAAACQIRTAPSSYSQRLLQNHCGPVARLSRQFGSVPL